jgi:RNA polymerase sigma-70 factor, ECF subfamily
MSTVKAEPRTITPLSPAAQECCRVAYSAHRRDIYRYFSVRLHDSVLAEDLTQEVFTAALPRLAELGANDRIVSAWLYKIAERRLADALRVRSRERERLAPLLSDGGPGEPSQPDSAAMPGLVQTIVGTIDALPPSQRVVLIAHLLEGRRFAEIAAGLGTTEAACKTRFARGIATVRGALIAAGLF